MNKSLLIAVACILTGIAIGYLLFDDGTVVKSTVTSGEGPAATRERGEPRFYRNPMNPAITSPVPAVDHMGMDYIPVYASDEEGPVGTVKIDPVIRHNIGLRTATAVRKAMSHAIRTPGRITFDEKKLVRLHPKVEGWIQEIYIDKTGQPVEYDQPLFVIR